ncbi:MAG: hypothetical protein HC802_04440 [Caldilineaceae bacterium]|nr:hypothetical protein [Caldilineaceae bacterium]
MEVFLALIGVGILAAAPSIPILRPIAKGAIKTGIGVTETTITVASVIKERMADARVNGALQVGVPPWLDDTDMLQIDGVGPKVSGHLNNAGVVTISQLAVTSVQTLQEILDAAGPNFGAIDCSTWPGQAQALLAGEEI